MNRTRVLIAGLLLLAAAFLMMTLAPSKPPRAAAPTESGDTRKGVGREQAGKPERPREAARPKAAQERPAAAAAAERPAAGGAAPAAAERQADVRTPREKAVAAWDALVDHVIAQKGTPAEEQAPRVKAAFDALDKQDQMDGIRRSLNLFPDEQFPALYGILFDKAEDPEVLDAIFSDALNRPEELKNPLMKELVKDKEHPCFFESARILDVIGELAPKPDEAEAPTPAPAPAPTPTP